MRAGPRSKGGRPPQRRPRKESTGGGGSNSSSLGIDGTRDQSRPTRYSGRPNSLSPTHRGRSKFGSPYHCVLLFAGVRSARAHPRTNWFRLLLSMASPCVTGWGPQGERPRNFSALRLGPSGPFPHTRRRRKARRPPNHQTPARSLPRKATVRGRDPWKPTFAPHLVQLQPRSVARPREGRGRSCGCTPGLCISQGHFWSGVTSPPPGR